MTTDGVLLDASTINKVCSGDLGANLERGNVRVNFNNVVSARRRLQRCRCSCGRWRRVEPNGELFCWTCSGLSRMSGCAEETWSRAIVMPGATHTDPRATPLIRDADHARGCRRSRTGVCDNCRRVQAVSLVCPGITVLVWCAAHQQPKRILSYAVDVPELDREPGMYTSVKYSSEYVRDRHGHPHV